MTPRQEMAAALGAVALGAVTALVAAGQPRVSAGLVGERVSGADTPVAAALGLVALAGAGVVLLVRNRTRQVIGALLAAVAAGIVAAYVSPADSASYSVFTPADDDIELRRSIWVWLGSAGGVVAAVGSLAVAARAGRWPEPRRYEATAPRSRRTADDPWDALDRGEDPTT